MIRLSFSVEGVRRGDFIAAAVLFAILLSLTGALVVYATAWPTDNRPQVWTGPADDDPAFRTLQERFGGDEAVLLRADRFKLDDPSALAWLEGLGPNLAKSPAVAGVVDPFHLPGAERVDARGSFIAALKRPITRTLALAAANPPRADFIVRMRAGAALQDTAALANAVNRVVDEGAAHGVRLRAGGHPLLAAALDGEARRVETLFAPLLALAAFVALIFSLRSTVLAAVTILPAAFASTAVRAILRALDWPSNLILVSAGPITFVIVLAATLHVTASFRRLYAEGMSAREAIRGAMREKLTAGILSGITTSIGFLVFATSPVVPVKRLGIAVAAAVIVAVPLEYLLVPRLLAGLALVRPRIERATKHRWRSAAFFAMRKRWAVIAIASAITIAGALAPAHLRQGTNALDYFPHGHPVRENFMDLEREDGALTTIDVIARRPGNEPWDLEMLAAAKIDQAIAAAPCALGVVGPECVAADAGSMSGVKIGFVVKAAQKKAARIDADGIWARWTVRVPTAEAAETARMRDDVLRAARAAAGLKGAEVSVTGGILRILSVQSHLVGTLWSSLALTLFVTAALFFLVIRTLRELAAALLANLLPTAIVLILPWIFGQPLDAATVMVASVVLGLAYNTFHLLAGAGPSPERRRLRAGLRSFDRFGRPSAASYVVLAAGFSVLALSGFAPTVRFGGLTAVGVLFALLGDLLVLPAVWLGAPRRH